MHVRKVLTTHPLYIDDAIAEEKKKVTWWKLGVMEGAERLEVSEKARGDVKRREQFGGLEGAEKLVLSGEARECVNERKEFDYSQVGSH